MCTVRCYINFSTFEDGSCVGECPGGTYETRQRADGTELGYCLPCDHACSTCNGASPRDCVTCSSAHLRLGEICVTHCPTGYDSVLGFDLLAGQIRQVPLRQTGFLSLGITETVPTASGATRPASCARVRGTSPAGPVCLPFWSCKARNCAWNAAHSAFIKWVTSANSVTPVVRPAQVLIFELIHHDMSILNIFEESDHVCVCVCVADPSPQGCLTCDWGSTLKDHVCYPRCEEGRYFSVEVSHMTFLPF